MVMPFSRSRSPLSIARSSTCWCSPNAPASQSILSTRVVFPWSTWATMATLRMSSRVFMGMGSIVSGFRGAPDHGRPDPGSGTVEHAPHDVDDGEVGREPGHGIQVLPAEPAQLVVVLDGSRLTTCHPRPEHGHRV